MSALNECDKCGTSYLGSACPTCLTSDAPPEPLRVGNQFRGFEILEQIGAGGMGVVYKARQTALDRIVALKVLPPDKARVPGFEDRFEREAKALAALSHPGIVSIHDFGREGDLFFIVMEFVDGANLRQKKVEPRRLALEILDALECAHRAEIVHRDLKPENILIDTSGRARLVDFGLAKHGDTTLTKSGGALGTAVYMAPEQMDRPNEADARADLYSLGIILQELWSGERPVGAFKPVNAIVRRAVERDPARRFQSAAEFREALRPKSIPGRIAGAILILAVAASAYPIWWMNLKAPEIPTPPKVPTSTPSAPDLPAEARTIVTGERISAIALRRDGLAVAAACGNYVLIWDLSKDEAPRRIDYPQNLLYTLVYSPDGRRLAVGGEGGGGVVEVESGETRFEFTGHERGIVYALAFHPDGKHLVVGGQTSPTQIWDCEAKTVVQTLDTPRPGLRSCAFSSDGTIFVTGGYDRRATVWKWGATEPLRECQGHEGAILSVAIARDLGLVVTGSTDKTVRVWDLGSGMEKARFRDHAEQVLSVSVQGARLISASYDGTVRLWDLHTLRLIRGLHQSNVQIRSASLRCDGRLAVAASTNGKIFLLPTDP